MRAVYPLVLLLVACQRDVKTPFPEGLEPLEDMAVEAPAPSGGEDYPETTTSTVGESDDYNWAHVRGYLHANIADVWELMRSDGPAMADRRDIDAWETTYDVEPEYDLTFVNHVTVNDIITLEWDLTYRGDLAGGDVDAPERYAIRFQKTEGSSLIDLQEGSIVLLATDDAVTEFQFIERLKAPQTSTEDPLTYGQDMHETLAVMLAGGAMPDWVE
ncbi:MAG: hypothetical protein EP330_12895 [Deltaproteobacteria bacterium]|nr:MAG: hypothetical protein EP330_12895 [Deltaproteobacteria bacterium]